MTDYFSELENQLGRVTARGIHNRRRLRGRPAGVRAVATSASVVLVSAVVVLVSAVVVLVSAVVLQTGGNRGAHPRTSTPPPAESVAQRCEGAYCVNSTTHTRMLCSPRTAESVPGRVGSPPSRLIPAGPAGPSPSSACMLQRARRNPPRLRV